MRRNAGAADDGGPAVSRDLRRDQWSAVETLSEFAESGDTCSFAESFDAVEDGGDQGQFGEFLGRDLLCSDEGEQRLAAGSGQDVGRARSMR